jgi:predicted ATPase/DNA-binding SARP family transcriptional activator
MTKLSLYLLGPPQLEFEGKPLKITRRKAMALLIYLAGSGERQLRDTLATLFWPESTQQGARKALRRDLSELNLALGGDWLDAGALAVGLRAGFWLDVNQFQRDAMDKNADLKTLMAATNLYRDDFLTGFTLPDCPAFDEWQFFQGESLRQTFAATLERVVRILSKQAHYDEAIPYARRRLALDPAHEPAHRQLMWLHAQAGQQAAALRQYESLRETLRDEFDLSPSEETTALYMEIRTGKLRAVAAISPTPRRHNLLTQTTTFIGREAEVAEIIRLLCEEPGCRLLNLVGPGGIGKTRLALAAAAQTLDAFPDGVYFVSLAPIGAVEYVIPAIAEAMRFTLFGNSEPKEQLLNYLASKRLLLVVDNYEHLLEEAGLLAEILNHAPDVTILATSRERLSLQEEWVYDVQGLTFPTTNDEGSTAFSAYSAVELFTQRTRQIVTGFAPSALEMADVVRICQLVEGMPLGLELAAPWIRTLSCREIAEEIQRNLDFLTTTLRNVPERHRSLSVVFEQTWRRLSNEEQAVLQQLSVFRGGCTRKAAEQVTGATLPVLSSLMHKALLRRTNTGRYELHELIRQFAETQLRTDPQAAIQARQRHKDFFVDFLEARTAGVKGDRQTETLAEIEADIDNVRLAWREAVTNRESEAIERSAECLFVYYLYRNGYDEGVLEFERVVAAFVTVPDRPEYDRWLSEFVGPDHKRNLVGFLLASLGYFVAHRRSLQRGQTLLEQALALLRRGASGDPRKVAFALLWLGWALYFQGRLTEGKRYGRESLLLLTETADHWGAAWAVLLLGACLRDGRPAEAEAVYQTGFALCRETGDQISLSYLSFNLGATLTELGQYAEAQQSIDLGVAISHRLNNILGLGYSLLRRGELNIAQGNYRQAVHALQQSWTYFNKVGAVHASRAQLCLGLAHHLQKEYDVAGQLYLQALEGFKAANNRLEPARCLNGLGWLAYDQGKLQQAEQFQRASLALLQETEPEPALVAATLRYLGQVMVAAGKHRHAEAGYHFREALELATEHRLTPIALDVCVGVAQLLVQREEKARAVKLLTRVAHHEAGTFAARETARQRLAELGDQLPLAEVQAAQAQEETLELWASVRTYLLELPVGATQN